jgi:hypothetical protein
MHGTLDTFSVVEVLQMLGRVRRSGTLHIECAERQIDVHFVQGQIAETRDSTRAYADTVLGSLLIKRSLITEEQLDLALREQESDPRPIGTILAQRGFVSEDDLRDVLSRQVANTFLAIKTTGNKGTFMFVIDPSAEPVDYITIDTQSVLIEVSSVGADYVAAFEILGAANTVLVRNRDYETLPRHALAMGRDEFHVLTLIDDRRTASEVAGASHLEEVTVISILGKFCQAKVLLPTGERPAAPLADGELRAHRDSVWDEVSRIAVTSPPPAAEPASPPPPEPPRPAAEPAPPPATAGPAAPPPAAEPAPPPFTAPVAEPGGPPELGADGSGLEWAFEETPDTHPDAPPAPDSGLPDGEGAGSPEPVSGGDRPPPGDWSW